MKSDDPRRLALEGSVREIVLGESTGRPASKALRN